MASSRQVGWLGLVVVILGALIILAVTYVPFVYALANSFKTGAEFLEQPMAVLGSFDWANYVKAWDGVSQYLGNTVIVGVLSAALAVCVAAPAGYFFAATRAPGKNVLFMAYVGLLLIPWLLTLVPLFLEVHAFHMDNTWWALVLPYAAGNQPLFVYLFRTFFEGIPKELFESARMDGASELAVLARVVTPLSVPILLTGSILMFIAVWGDYLWPQLVLTNYHLLTISAGLEVFLSGMTNGALGGVGLSGIGPQFAAYVIAMGPIILLIMITMRYFVQGLTSGSVKA